jgi:hypothetical protein
MRILCSLLILGFFLCGLGCGQSQEEPVSTIEKKSAEKAEKTPELTDEEKDKLKSLGYVE